MTIVIATRGKIYADCKNCSVLHEDYLSENKNSKLVVPNKDVELKIDGARVVAFSLSGVRHRCEQLFNTYDGLARQQGGSLEINTPEVSTAVYAITGAGRLDYQCVALTENGDLYGQGISPTRRIASGEGKDLDFFSRGVEWKRNVERNNNYMLLGSGGEVLEPAVISNYNPLYEADTTDEEVEKVVLALMRSACEIDSQHCGFGIECIDATGNVVEHSSDMTAEDYLTHAKIIFGPTVKHVHFK